MKLFLEEHRLYPQRGFINFTLSPSGSGTSYYMTFLTNPITATL